MATQHQASIKDRTDIKEPQMYDVLMLNDDFTTMDFVVMILKNVFYHNAADAEALMLDIHNKGICVVGTFTLDIAQSKVAKATRLAREEGFPLRLKIQQHNK